MFEMPGSNICNVEITEDVVEGKSEPIYTRTSEPEESAQEDFESGGQDATRAVNNWGVFWIKLWTLF